MVSIESPVGKSLLSGRTTGTDGDSNAGTSGESDGYAKVEDAVREGVVEGLREYERDVHDANESGSGSSRRVSGRRLVGGAVGLAGLAYLVRRRRRNTGDAALSQRSTAGTGTSSEPDTGVAGSSSTAGNDASGSYADDPGGSTANDRE